MLFQLCTKHFQCLSVLPNHIKIGAHTISPCQNKSLLFVSVFLNVTPTNCWAVLAVSSHVNTKGFHVMSFNCKPFVSRQCYYIYRVHLLHGQNIWSETLLRHYIFGDPISPPSTRPSLPARVPAGGLWFWQHSVPPVSPSFISPPLPFMVFLLCMMNVIAFALFN